MNRSSALILAGVALLLASASVPFLELAATEWETNYVYVVEEDSYCASSVVHDGPVTEADDDFRRDFENLSATGQNHFKAALEDGRLVVKDENDTAPDFEFTAMIPSAESGCYAVSYDGETYALSTCQESQRIRPWPKRLNGFIDRLLLVTGVGSIFAGLGLAVKRRV